MNSHLSGVEMGLGTGMGMGMDVKVGNLHCANFLQQLSSKLEVLRFRPALLSPRSAIKSTVPQKPVSFACVCLSI